MTTEQKPDAIHVPDKGAQGCLIAVIGMVFCVVIAMWSSVIGFLWAVLS